MQCPFARRLSTRWPPADFCNSPVLKRWASTATCSPVSTTVRRTATSLEMARIAVADGITTTFCTPHIYPGLYENNAVDIRHRVANLQLILQNQNIPLAEFWR